MSVIHGGARTDAQVRWSTVRRMLASVVVASAAACASGPGTSPAPVPDGQSASRASTSEGSSESRFRLAMNHIQREEFDAAAEELAGLAATCEGGPWGGTAVLLLASLELNPRNASGSPSAGARLAARYLQVPTAPPASVAVAETLYLLAVDLGADPVTDPLEAGSGGTALSFEDCDESREPVIVRELPRHPGSPTTRAALVRASAQRDSLAAAVDSLTLKAAELQGELDRIRRLLVPDSVGRGEDRRSRGDRPLLGDEPPRGDRPPPGDRPPGR